MIRLDFCVKSFDPFLFPWFSLLCLSNFLFNVVGRPNQKFINYADMVREPRPFIKDIAAMMEVDLTDERT